MAQIPTSKAHSKQIEAGTIGRKEGHKFEALLAAEINKLNGAVFTPTNNTSHLLQGNPARNLIQYISNNRNTVIKSVKASWLGGLATSGLGDAITDDNGNPITKSKSDVLIKIQTQDTTETVGISVKTCNKKNPTNDQMFFTTAKAFCQLLSGNGIEVSEEAMAGLSMFCGDVGYRPADRMSKEALAVRNLDPNRYYWEEMPIKAQNDWNDIISKNQDEISLLLFQKAYKDDPFPPEYLLHQTVKYTDFKNCETAIFSTNEIIQLSKKHSGFVLSGYRIYKGTYKNKDVVHMAPRFGIIQFQRGGQKVHPTQLQFNLKSGYFYILKDYFDKT